MDEDDLVDLIMLAGTRSSRDHIGHLSGSPFHWAKLVFFVSNDLDLEITRYWYMLGCYVDSPHARPTMAEHLDRRVIINGFPDPNKVIQLAGSREGKDIYKEIRAAVDGYLDIFKIPTDDLRLSIYRNDAPEEFRHTYLGHFELIKKCRELASMNVLDSPDRLWRQFSDSVSELHRGLFRSKVRPDCRMAVMEHTGLMENIVQKLIFVDRPSEEWVKRWRSVLRKCDETYQNYVWRFPASQFGAQSVVGKRKDAKKAELLRNMDGSRDFIARDLPAAERELESEGVTLTVKGSEEIMSRLVPSSEARDKIAKAYYDRLMAR